MCVLVLVCVCGNLISQILQGRQIYIILSHFPGAPSQTQKNGGNSVTLATDGAYVQREAADGGGKAGDGGKKLTQVHTVL